MAKDEFDFDFDFEKEFGLNPGDYAQSADADGDLTFTDAELGLSPDAGQRESDDDFDLTALDDLLGEDPTAAPADSFEGDFGFDGPEDPSFDDVDLDGFPDFSGEDAAADLVARKNREQPVRSYEPPVEEVMPQEPVTPEIPRETPDQTAAAEEIPPQDDHGERKKRERKPLPSFKLKTPNIFTRFFDLYFGPVINKDYQQELPADPNKPRRRRKKSKMQIFKEVYLPPIVACLCLILVLAFTVGATTNFVRQKQSDKAREESQLQESQSAEELAAQAARKALAEAAALATTYNYTEAVEVLEAFMTSVEDKSAYPEITTQRSAYVTAQSQLVEYMDPSTIPNLSFHTLMVDPARSLRDPEYGGLYNRNFVSIGEFQKILDSLYNDGYVLVDFDSFTEVNGEQIFPKTISLPQGKKPIMITSTMVNYYAYMVDGDKDGEPDASGDGFANKLVLENGEIKASYVDSNGSKLIGDYDLVPILETFIKEHPSFSYQGARATLAISGHEGIFGYRINSSYIANKSQTYVDGEIAGAKAVVQALRDKGYDLACYTYADIDYGVKNANQIMDDLNKWEADIVSVIGPVDKFVFAKSSDLTDYNGNAFKVMRDKGFKYFIANGSEPWADVRSDYVRQRRMMVTGNALGWRQEEFKGIFDCNAVVDMATRVSIPN